MCGVRAVVEECEARGGEAVGVSMAWVGRPVMMDPRMGRCGEQGEPDVLEGGEGGGETDGGR